ncbi:MAG: UPF0223 family protein [Bacillales bacterium]|nr:UPF0223 family protein [Bacillales bacterium]
MNYEYPLDYETYSVKDIEKIIDFLSYLEDNLKVLDPDTFKKKYNIYRNTLSSIKEEKRIDKEFTSLSGISIYKTAKKFGL